MLYYYIYYIIVYATGSNPKQTQFIYSLTLVTFIINIISEMTCICNLYLYQMIYDSPVKDNVNLVKLLFDSQELDDCKTCKHDELPNIHRYNFRTQDFNEESDEEYDCDNEEVDYDVNDNDKEPEFESDYDDHDDINDDDDDCNDCYSYLYDQDDHHSDPDTGRE